MELISEQGQVRLECLLRELNFVSRGVYKKRDVRIVADRMAAGGLLKGEARGRL